MLYNITDIAYQQIKGDYYWARYGDFKVIMNKATGYINATKLCQLANSKEGKPKRFDHWRENIESKQLIEAVSASSGIPGGTLLTEPSVSNELRGVYAHHLLIPHIASWASPVFAVKVSVIISDEMVRKHREEMRVKDTKIDDLERTLNAIKQQNDEQSKKLSEQSVQMQEQTAQMKEQAKRMDILLTEVKESRTEILNTTDQLDDMTAEVAALNINNTELKTTVNAIATKLDVAVERRVPVIPDDSRNEVYAIYHMPGTLNYKSTSTQKVSHSGVRTRYRAAGYTSLLLCIETPNARNLKVRIAKTMPANIGRASNCDIVLLQGASPKDLVAFVRAVEAEKKHVVITI